MKKAGVGWGSRIYYFEESSPKLFSSPNVLSCVYCPGPGAPGAASPNNEQFCCFGFWWGVKVRPKPGRWGRRMGEGLTGSIWQEKISIGPVYEWPFQRHSVHCERAAIITELQRLQMFWVCFNLHLLVFCAGLLGIPKNVNNEYVMSSKNESLPCLPLPIKLINPSTKIKTAWVCSSISHESVLMSK